MSWLEEAFLSTFQADCVYLFNKQATDLLAELYARTCEEGTTRYSRR